MINNEDLFIEIDYSMHLRNIVLIIPIVKINSNLFRVTCWFYSGTSKPTLVDYLLNGM